MIICPWCGTNYLEFQPNCKNCGGPIDAPKAAVTPGEQLPEPPPPAPRPIADRYTLKLMATDGGSIVGFVFALVGGIFFVVGAGLTLGVVTAFVGIPFILLGLAMLGGAAGLLYWRYQKMQAVVNVLRWGQSVCGEVTGVDQNVSIQVNGRSPWIIGYRFQINGQEYTGQVSTLNFPGLHLQPGRPAYVLYMPDSPALNALYPHP